MSKPAIFFTVNVEIPIRTTVVKELLVTLIEDVLTDKAKGAWTETIRKTSHKIANFVMKSYEDSYSDEWDDYDIDEIWGIIEDIVGKEVRNETYTERWSLDVDDLSSTDVNKLKKIMKRIVNTYLEKNGKVKKEKEDPCITELKSFAKKLGYTLSKN